MLPRIHGAPGSPEKSRAGNAGGGRGRGGRGRSGRTGCAARTAAAAAGENVNYAYSEFLAKLRRHGRTTEEEDRDGGRPEVHSQTMGAELRPTVQLTRVDLRTRQHKACNIPGQRAGTVLVLFRHYARIGHHHHDAKKLSKKSRPSKMSYHGLQEFVKDWLEPGGHTVADDVPHMWQAVIKNKMNEQGTKDASALRHLNPHDFLVFLMIAILAYKNRLHMASTTHAKKAFVDALCLENRSVLLDRLRDHHHAFHRTELVHFHEQVLDANAGAGRAAQPPEVATSPKVGRRVRNFARHDGLAGELKRRFLYAMPTKAEATWLPNGGVLRLLQNDARFEGSVAVATADSAAGEVQHLDLSFGVEIGKTYHVRLGVHLRRPKEVVAAADALDSDDVDDADDFGTSDAAADAAAASASDAAATAAAAAARRAAAELAADWKQECSLATVPMDHARTLQARVQGVRQVSCVPAHAGGAHAGGEEVDLEVMVVLRPRAQPGVYSGTLDLRLTEGAGQELLDTYPLPPVPYFVFVRDPGVRRPAPPGSGRAKQPLPLVLNTRGMAGAAPAVDFSQLSSVKAVVGSDLTPSEKQARDSPTQQLIQRVRRSMHLTHTLSKAFNFRSADESLEL